MIVKCKPYPLEVPLTHVALIMVNFQQDIISCKGFASSQGLDVSRMQCAIPSARRLLHSCRKAGFEIVHTVEAHSSTLDNLSLSKFKRGNKTVGQRIGDIGPLGRIMVNGEIGTAIVEEVAPTPDEKLVHCTGKSAFFNTDLDEYLRKKNITHLIIAGMTTEMGVEATMRDANDRGYESILATDATESYVPNLKKATIDTIISQGGAIGWCATTEDILEGFGLYECGPRSKPISVPDTWSLRPHVNITRIPL